VRRLETLEDLLEVVARVARGGDHVADRVARGPLPLPQHQAGDLLHLRDAHLVPVRESLAQRDDGALGLLLRHVPEEDGEHPLLEEARILHRVRRRPARMDLLLQLGSDLGLLAQVVLPRSLPEVWREGKLRARGGPEEIPATPASSRRRRPPRPGRRHLASRLSNRRFAFAVVRVPVPCRRRARLRLRAAACADAALRNMGRDPALLKIDATMSLGFAPTGSVLRALEVDLDARRRVLRSGS
jgi:hypothetical protein